MKKTLLICIMCLVAALCLCLSACSPKHTHDFSSGVYNKTATGHSEKCKDDDTYGPEEPHTFGEDGKCTVCGYEHTHSFTSDVFEKSDAGHKRKCTDCNQYGEIEQHTFGTDGKTCTVCGYEKKETSTHEHNLKKVDKKDPTCTEKGNIEYYTCDGKDCSGKYFDKDGKELDEKDVFIDAKGHDFTSGKYESTKEGHKQQCKNCDEYEETVHEHEFENGVCKDCGYKENSEDLELPENLDGEYVNGKGATIKIEDTTVTVTMSDQTQEPLTFTITGYEDGNITLDKDFELGGGQKIELVFDEENETLTAGYLGTFYKVKEFDLPETLDGTYVNEDGDEIEVSNADKTATVDSKDYIIIYYDDENNLTLFETTDGDIIEMTYDDENDKLTYNDVEYAKKTEEELKLPDNLSGTYKNEIGATIVIDGTSFALTMPQQQQPQSCTITGYDDESGELTLNPPLSLGDPVASVVKFNKDDETITISTLVGSTFTKVKEEEPEKPEIPEDINGVYKDENGAYMLVLGKEKIFIDGTEDHNLTIEEYIPGDSNNLKTIDDDDVTEYLTYNKDAGTITHSDWGTFSKYTVPARPDSLQGEYKYNSYTITVDGDTLTEQLFSFSAPEIYTIVDYVDSSIKGMRHDNGYMKSFAYDATADTITDSWYGTFTKPVETPTLELPEKLNGEYYTKDEVSEIAVEGDTFEYYEDYDSYGDTYTITEYKDGTGTVKDEDGNTKTFEYNEDTDTITFEDREFKKEWTDEGGDEGGEDDEKTVPAWLIGTWDNGAASYSKQYFIIGETTVDKYRGASPSPSATFDIESVTDSSLVLKCKTGGFQSASINWVESDHSTITFIGIDSTGVPQNITCHKSEVTAAANILNVDAENVLQNVTTYLNRAEDKFVVPENMAWTKNIWKKVNRF